MNYTQDNVQNLAAVTARSMEEEPYAYLASTMHIKPVGQVLYNIYILTSALKVSR